MQTRINQKSKYTSLLKKNYDNIIISRSNLVLIKISLVIFEILPLQFELIITGQSFWTNIIKSRNNKPQTFSKS